MKTIERKTMFAALSAALLALLAACGDETTNTTAYGTENAVSALNKAGKCTEERMGETVYAEKEGMLYVCDGSLWVSMKGEDGQKGARGDSGSVGDDGDSGNPGAKGASCTIKTADGATQLVCGSATYTISSEGDESGVFTDKRDGKVYPWVKIAGLVWMAKNLDVGTMVKKPAGGNYETQASSGNRIEKWCAHDSAAYCDTLGGYYQWHTAMAVSDTCLDHRCADQLDTLPVIKWVRHRGICPEGWHIPAPREYMHLKGFADTVANFSAQPAKAAMALASIGKWFDGKGTDAFGFAAMPTSFLTPAGNLAASPQPMALLVADAPTTATNANIFMSVSTGVVQLNVGYGKVNGFTLRCVKDWAPESVQF